MKDHFELVVANSVWESVSQTFATGDARVVLAYCRQSEHMWARELLVDHVVASGGVSVLEQAEPNIDWTVIVLGRLTDDELKRIPRFAIRLTAVLELDLEEDRERWSGFVHERGRMEPLDALKIVGPMMPSFRRLLKAEARRRAC